MIRRHPAVRHRTARRMVLVLLAAAWTAPLQISGGAQAARVHVERLRTNNAENPIGIGTAVPRFSWQLRSEARGIKQTAYQIRVAAGPANLKPCATFDHTAFRSRTPTSRRAVPDPRRARDTDPIESA